MVEKSEVEVKAETDTQEIKEAENKLPTPLVVEKAEQDGNSLYVEIISDDRDMLVSKGRQHALDHVTHTENWASWSNSGVEAASGPSAFDPENPTVDAYQLTEEARKTGREITWRYRQTYKLTKMI